MSRLQSLSKQELQWGAREQTSLFKKIYHLVLRPKSKLQCREPSGPVLSRQSTSGISHHQLQQGTGASAGTDTAPTEGTRTGGV